MTIILQLLQLIQVGIAREIRRKKNVYKILHGIAVNNYARIALFPI